MNPALTKMLLFKRKTLKIGSHFANVEDLMNLNYAKLQLSLFQTARNIAATLGINATPHIASSASTLFLDDISTGLFRVSISMYGLWLSQVTRLSYLNQNPQLLGLQEFPSWKTEVTLVKTSKNSQIRKIYRIWQHL